MTLQELSAQYAESDRLLTARLAQLRRLEAQSTDADVRWRLHRRILRLHAMRTQVRELAELTEHYYDRGYWRNEKYTV